MIADLRSLGWRHAADRISNRFTSVTFHLSCELISDASLGLDDLRCARIVLQFAAKAENLHIYAAIEHVFVDSSRL